MMPDSSVIANIEDRQLDPPVERVHHQDCPLHEDSMAEEGVVECICDDIELTEQDIAAERREAVRNGY